MQPDAITVTAAVQDAEEMLEILSIYPEHLNPTNLSGLKTNLGFSRDIRENLGFLTKSSCFAPKPSIAMCRCSIFIFSRRLIKFSVVKTCFTIC